MNVFSVKRERVELYSDFLDRDVKVDFYVPAVFNTQAPYQFLVINDGQDLELMEFDLILGELQGEIKPLIVAGIHCGPERKMEYGVAGFPDFKGRGARAADYAEFIFKEFLPFAEGHFHVDNFPEKSFAGFSLGGLSALDMVWSYPGEFRLAGVFSGSLWWRSVDQNNKEYDDDRHRIIHQRVRQGKYFSGLKFFFQCGSLDESRDRNQNGIIDSIDDTVDMIKELKAKGYSDDDIFYCEMPDGRHDVATWARAVPLFLRWAFGIK